MEKRHFMLIAALLSAAILIIPGVNSVFAGQHWFYDAGVTYCLKCHSDIKQQLAISIYHQSFTCENCHVQNITSNLTHGNVVDPGCLDCHGRQPREVKDSQNNKIISVVANVFGENVPNKEAHNPLVKGAKNASSMKGENEACIFCHSSYGSSVTYTRPGFIEWDVENLSGIWAIKNLSIGSEKEIHVTKNSDGRSHNISSISDITCVSCHEDINSAVLIGSHSGNSSKHNFTQYTNMNSYCSSCHKPQTAKSNGISPYPDDPFNSPVHSAIGITCLDCHGRYGDLLVNINNGIKNGMEKPLHNSGDMGNIEISIRQQPIFVQSYLCIACKNTGNPVPNTSIHFKLYTEPDVMIYVNGTLQYPR